jgi:hypothetical protein
MNAQPAVPSPNTGARIGAFFVVTLQGIALFVGLGAMSPPGVLGFAKVLEIHARLLVASVCFNVALRGGAILAAVIALMGAR